MQSQPAKPAARPAVTLTSCSSHVAPPLQTPPTALTSPHPATREPSRVRGPGRCCSADAGTCAIAGGTTLLGLLPCQCTPAAISYGCHVLLNFAAGLKIPRVPSWNESDANIAKKVRVLQPCAHANQASMAAYAVVAVVAVAGTCQHCPAVASWGWRLRPTWPPLAPPSHTSPSLSPHRVAGLLPAQPAAHRPGDRRCAGLRVPGKGLLVCISAQVKCPCRCALACLAATQCAQSSAPLRPAVTVAGPAG